MAFWTKLFRRRPAPRTVESYLLELEQELSAELASFEEGSSESDRATLLEVRLNALSKLDELRARPESRKNQSFLTTPAGASLLTGFLTITATQMPAMWQAINQQRAAHQATEIAALAPIVESIANDTELSVDKRLALISFISEGDYRYESFEEFKRRLESDPDSRLDAPDDDSTRERPIEGDTGDEHTTSLESAQPAQDPKGAP